MRDCRARDLPAQPLSRQGEKIDEAVYLKMCVVPPGGHFGLGARLGATFERPLRMLSNEKSEVKKR
jgi:hypothetical protein